MGDASGRLDRNDRAGGPPRDASPGQGSAGVRCDQLPLCRVLSRARRAGARCAAGLPNRFRYRRSERRRSQSRSQGDADARRSLLHLSLQVRTTVNRSIRRSAERKDPRGGSRGFFVPQLPAPSLSARRKPLTYFRELLIDVYTPFRLLPNPLTTAMIAREMPAAIKPYSIAVAP